MAQPSPPEAVFGSFLDLSADDQLTFLKLIARAVRAELIFVLLAELNQTERERYAEQVRHAIGTRKVPEDTDPELEALIDEAKKAVSAQLQIALKRALAGYKATRDRQSDPETIRRNVEICDLRKQDPKTWTQGRLAKKYGLHSAGTIRLILKDEAKWRELAAGLSGD